MAKHPGGSGILAASRGRGRSEDLAPLFESYHAFANVKSIKATLSEYRVKDVGVEVHGVVDGLPVAADYDEETFGSFRPGGAYDEMRRRVRAHFAAKSGKRVDDPMSMGYSVTSSVKAGLLWYGKAILQVVAWAFCMWHMWTAESLSVATLAGIGAGCFNVQLGFCVFHDTSHFAADRRNGWFNDLLSHLWCGIAMWDSATWRLHHVIRHHAYTGSDTLDPDVRNFQPMLRKSSALAKGKYLRVSEHWLGTWAAVFLTVFPGMYVGSILAYARWMQRGFMWNTLYYGKDASDALSSRLELTMKTAMVVAHVYFARTLPLLAFLIACNICYAVCIVPDHDSADTARNLATARREKGVLDWGEQQVVASGNFFKGRTQYLFAMAMGGINLQIEHHLFPSMAHTHLMEVAPIVRSVCKERGIPYVHAGGVVEAWNSFVQLLINVAMDRHGKEE
eukprot:CAMPEP_0170738600 /NCGR_PEP_ID=MMETSP0437-20130122/4728_1 /TAXON_ID=0 /ORGANISM="Sexangularia sp." /LENGTH=449 /DNA_ID=CAMNT_0011077027 /DNA_START=155 /DNA_END=1504 /DNA_ORIENTATION=-